MDLFESEQNTLDFVSKKLTDDNCGECGSERSCLKLFNSYEKMLKDTRRVVKMSDRREIHIKKLNKKLKEKEEKISQMHKQTQDSIKYASLIQHSIIPDDGIFEYFFSDFFSLWKPKDVVGGDIYLCIQPRNDECILFVIDCTGHGVPGAFVTMLVKAVEIQIGAILYNNNYIEMSPTWILNYFNKTIKKLLNQETKDSISNAGFDGGVVYYNKKEGIIKYSGAQVPLFYFNKEGELITISGDKQSIGYTNSELNYEYKEHIIKVEKGMQFYITTDGYLDQLGGEKEFPLGKTRFKEILTNCSCKPLFEQKEIFEQELNTYKGNHFQTDDITVVGFKI